MPPRRKERGGRKGLEERGGREGERVSFNDDDFGKKSSFTGGEGRFNDAEGGGDHFFI